MSEQKERKWYKRHDFNGFLRQTTTTTFTWWAHLCLVITLTATLFAWILSQSEDSAEETVLLCLSLFVPASRQPCFYFTLRLLLLLFFFLCCYFLFYFILPPDWSVNEAQFGSRHADTVWVCPNLILSKAGSIDSAVSSAGCNWCFWALVCSLLPLKCTPCVLSQ